VPAGFAVNPNLAIVLPFMCHEDEETAIDRGIDGGHFFGYSLLHYYAFGQHHPGRTDIWAEFQEKRSQFGFDRTIAAGPVEHLGATIEQNGIGSLRGAVGTPDQIRRLVRDYEEVGVDQVIFVAQAGRNRHEHICEALELFAREVLPEFADRADRAEKEKLERLAPAMDAALARRSPPRELDPDYSFPAVMKP
jgi:alkanesulfonate monooxygenase SsuD/methylene tetrahydromethanopterin reductase-like flavin-dependent oxidoreductase (luciferase family)